jgi:hypothetical protein
MECCLLECDVVYGVTLFELLFGHLSLGIEGTHEDLFQGRRCAGTDSYELLHDRKNSLEREIPTTVAVLHTKTLTVTTPSTATLSHASSAK